MMRLVEESDVMMEKYICFSFFGHLFDIRFKVCFSPFMFTVRS